MNAAAITLSPPAVILPLAEYERLRDLAAQAEDVYAEIEVMHAKR